MECFWQVPDHMFCENNVVWRQGLYCGVTNGVFLIKKCVMDDIVYGCVSQGMTKQGATTQLTYASCAIAPCCLWK